MNNLVRRNNNNLSFIDEFFDDFFIRPAYKTSGSCMRTDIREIENGYELDIDVPGFAKEDIKISLEKGYLTIEAKKDETKEQKDQHFLRRERFLGSSARSFYVGEEIAVEDIKANHNLGILTVFIPKQGTNVKEKKFIDIG
ncbi:MAG: Hsp20/alpha crystallin family protein [Bacillus subtilis]|nr:Hsp20/alpha crystallin family protein [Bacillus subtilis]